MAKKNNTLLYAGIAAAALLLFKKKDSGMAGVGAKKTTDIMINGKPDFIRELLPYFRYYVDKRIVYSDDMEIAITFTYSSVKNAEEALRLAISLIQEDYPNYIVNKHVLRKQISYTIRKANKTIFETDWANVFLIKGSLSK